MNPIAEKPTFLLPGCPVCSHGRYVESPVWHFAHRTSAREKAPFYMWQGCPHARVLRDTFPTGRPEEWRETENRWLALVPELFEKKTTGWGEARKAQHAHHLGLVGYKSIFSPASPVQPEQTKTEERK